MLGHSEIEGNEIADTEAKRAATNPSAAMAFHHRPLKSAKAQWLEDWTSQTKLHMPYVAS